MLSFLAPRRSSINRPPFLQLIIIYIFFSTTAHTQGVTAPSSWPACPARPFPAISAQERSRYEDVHRDLDALLQDAVANQVTQSAALVVVRKGKIFYRGRAGAAQQGSIFDLASLTKVIATAPSVMQLVEAKKLRLTDWASAHLPLLATPDKKLITPYQLLMHSSGLHSVVRAGKPDDGRELIIGRIGRSTLKSTPGAAYRYSDLGYILLGELVGAASGMSLDRYVQQHLFGPLQMCATGFNPPQRLHAQLITPWPRGEKIAIVYDPLAARMNGVAGHAGLYSTAEDLARFGQMMLNRGMLEGKRVLSSRSVALMLRPRKLPGGAKGQRGLGWDFSSPHAGSKGRLSAAAYGHTGFTGTSLWVDPRRQLVIVLLTNRTYFEPAPSVSPLRRHIHDLLATSLDRKPAQAVQTGLDQLAEQGFAALRGKRVGLITNRTAVDRRGRWIVDVLAAVPDLTIQALFVPEHGLAAKQDRYLGDGSLKKRGRTIPVYSLFGSRRRPTAKTLAGIQVLVFDMQTVGVRYYTYLATMGWAMEEAAKHKLPFIVLDRPNPLGGARVQGPVSSASRRTSTNYHPLPVRYGLTLGELAQLFKGERKIPVTLSVVPAKHWQREQLFFATGLPWVNPSPNIRSWRQAMLYAGIGLLESTNLAVGRGTDSPFQLLGAPWIDGPALARRLNRQHLPGIYFTAVTFTPQAKPYRGETCQGVRVVLLDPFHADPVAVGITLAVFLRKLYPQQWETRHLFRLFNHPATTQAILGGKGVQTISALWTAERKRFLAVRRRYLLY